MTEETKFNSKRLIGKVIVSKSRKRFGEVGDIDFEVRTGELISIILKNPTGYAEGLELEKNKSNHTLIPFSSVVATGDFIVVSEEDII